ncbi:MAG: orotidine-5'-phosphate decarboxylase [Pseudomonadota bacterium]
MHAEDRLIIALDVPNTHEALALITALGPRARFFKIGYQLMSVGGFDLARTLIADGKSVFLDLKFHDIGNTVEKGVASVRTLGARMLTVHAEPEVLRGAVAGRGDDPTLKIMAVTVLTSMSQESLARLGIKTPVETLVLQRAEMALAAGADGVIASAQEAPAIRRAFGDDLLIVTPGIRPAGAKADDQKRVVTPRQALDNGASHLVVGRPIVAADDPQAALGAILDQMTG